MIRSPRKHNVAAPHSNTQCNLPVSKQKRNQRDPDLEIILYPHPTLRHKSRLIQRVDRELKSIVVEMFDLMYQARGIGLAANQVDLPLQLFVINTAGEQGQGEEVVFINPVISRPKGTNVAEEGCLSLPGINGQVSRPAQIHISAYDLSGNEIDLTADGLLARAIQHECDHINGVLFIDRISDSEKKQIDSELEEFVLDFNGRRAANAIPSDNEILKRLKTIEARYC